MLARNVVTSQISLGYGDKIRSKVYASQIFTPNWGERISNLAVSPQPASSTLAFVKILWQPKIVLLNHAQKPTSVIHVASPCLKMRGNVDISLFTFIFLIYYVLTSNSMALIVYEFLSKLIKL